MMKPMSFETSWEEAEAAMHKHLIDATGTEDNKSAFLGRNPGVLNAWHLEPSNTPYNQPFSCKDVPAMAMQYRVVGVFTKRENCLRLAMQLAAGLPVKGDGESNISILRVAEIGNVEYDVIQPTNEAKPVGYWQIGILLDLAFSTGGKELSLAGIGG